MIKKLLTGIGLLGCIWLFAGCAEVVVPGSLAGGSEIYRYTTGNVAKRTFVSNVSQVTKAAHSALKKMNIQYHSTSLVDSETEMKASTDALDITISLTPITTTTTKVDVDAVKNRVFKDKATAAEILYQIELELAGSSDQLNALPKVFVKNDCLRALDIVVYYLAADNGPASWQTRGWFSVEPGQKKHIADQVAPAAVQKHSCQTGECAQALTVEDEVDGVAIRSLNLLPELMAGRMSFSPHELPGHAPVCHRHLKETPA